LAIEVEVTRRLLDRKAIYAKLGVRELWVYNGKKFRIIELGADASYQPVSNSSAFPMIRFAGIERLLQRAGGIGELEWNVLVEKWVRKSLPE
jgi:hypothetical protein